MKWGKEVYRKICINMKFSEIDFLCWDVVNNIFFISLQIPLVPTHVLFHHAKNIVSHLYLPYRKFSTWHISINVFFWGGVQLLTTRRSEISVVEYGHKQYK